MSNNKRLQRVRGTNSIRLLVDGYLRQQFPQSKTNISLINTVLVLYLVFDGFDKKQRNNASAEIEEQTVTIINKSNLWQNVFGTQSYPSTSKSITTFIFKLETVIDAHRIAIGVISSSNKPKSQPDTAVKPSVIPPPPFIRAAPLPSPIGAAPPPYGYSVNGYGSKINDRYNGHGSPPRATAPVVSHWKTGDTIRMILDLTPPFYAKLLFQRNGYQTQLFYDELPIADDQEYTIMVGLSQFGDCIRLIDVQQTEYLPSYVHWNGKWEAEQSFKNYNVSIPKLLRKAKRANPTIKLLITGYLREQFVQKRTELSLINALLIVYFGLDTFDGNECGKRIEVQHQTATIINKCNPQSHRWHLPDWQNVFGTQSYPSTSKSIITFIFKLEKLRWSQDIMVGVSNSLKSPLHSSYQYPPGTQRSSFAVNGDGSTVSDGPPPPPFPKSETDLRWKTGDTVRMILDLSSSPFGKLLFQKNNHETKLIHDNLPIGDDIEYIMAVCLRILGNSITLIDVEYTEDLPLYSKLELHHYW